MEYNIDTKIISQSIKENGFMPYFLNPDANLLFKENMMEIFSQLKEEHPLTLVYNDSPIDEKTWIYSKFVGSFFTSLLSHWTKIIKETNIVFVEVTNEFPEELTIDADENNFILFYRAKEGMISKRDECILDSSNEWIEEFFNWLYSEILEVGNITNLIAKYKTFTEIFVSKGYDPTEDEDEPFSFPDDFYEDLEGLRESIKAALGDVILEDSTLYIPSTLSTLSTPSTPSTTPINPVTIDFYWNENKPDNHIHLTFPFSVNEWISENPYNLALLDNENGWLVQQDDPIKETVIALWADYVYSVCMAQPEKTLILNSGDFASRFRNWLRHETGNDIKKIDKKIKITENKIRENNKILGFIYAGQPQFFFKVMLYIEKQASLFEKRHCLIDVENIQHQYFYSLANDNVFFQIWTAIVHEKIQKKKGRQTFPKQFEDLKELFPNFKEVIDYYSGAMYIYEQTGTPPAPVLLLGSPGLGKTHFSSEIAKIVGSQMTVLAVSSLSAGWIISGAASQWKDAQMGKIASSLLNGTTMAPVIVLDEIDKKSEGNYDPLGALYPLLEYQTAKEFVDEYLEFPLDASNIIWVATANSLVRIPEPILDRFVVFDIVKLNPEQTRKVAKTIFSDITKGLNPEDLSEDILLALQDKTPRQIKQILKKGLAYAAVQRGQKIVLQTEHLDVKLKNKKFGF